MLAISSALVWVGLSNFGLAQGLQNALSDEVAHGTSESQKILISTAVTVLLTIVICMSIAWFAFSPLIPWLKIFRPATGNFVKDIVPSVEIAFFGFLSQFLVSFIPAVYAARQEVHYGNIAGIFYAFSNLLGTAVGVALHCRLEGMILSTTVATTVWCWSYATWYFCRPELREIVPNVFYFRFAALRRLRSLSVAFFVIQLCSILLFESEPLLLIRFASPASVTAYNVALRPFALSNSLFGFIAQPLWAAYGNAKARFDLPWIKKTHSRVLRLYWRFYLPFFVLIIAGGPLLLRLWVGGVSAPGRLLLILVGLYFGIRMRTDLNATLVNGLDAMRPEAVAAIAHALITVTLNVFLISRYGVFGLPIANFLGYAMVSAWALPLIARRALDRMDKQTTS